MFLLERDAIGSVLVLSRQLALEQQAASSALKWSCSDL